MQSDSNIQAFFALVKAGLWEEDVRLSNYDDIDYSTILRIAEEQSVVGLVTAGLEKASDVKVPKEAVLQFVGSTLQIEQRNKEMNDFVARLIERLRKEDVYAILVKGQGIAQCYEKPLWRACGDVDLLLSDEDYAKAKTLLSSFADSEEPEVLYKMHKAYKINGREVELHGNLRGRFLKRVDLVVDEIQKSVFKNRDYRVWKCGEVDIFLPAVESDVIFVFIHILQHFFIEGIGLRQFCDLCRLIWVYKENIDKNLLENRLRKMGMITEWKVLAAIFIEYLGMPADVMPFYSSETKWKNKADRVMDFVLETGNFGHNRDYDYYHKYPFVVSKVISLWRHSKDGYRYFRIFPMDAIKIWYEMIGTGINVAIKGL